LKRKKKKKTAIDCWSNVFSDEMFWDGQRNYFQDLSEVQDEN
jgi:hypothetical protein